MRGLSMTMRPIVHSVLAAVFGLAAMAPVLAQAASPTFTVSNVTGDVLVLRGNKVYQVANGSTLLPGDRVFTRSAGSAVVQQLNTCSLSLPSASSVTIPSTGAACWLDQSQILALSSNTTIGGYTIGAAGVNTVVAATALTAVGVTVLATNGSSSP